MFWTIQPGYKKYDYKVIAVMNQSLPHDDKIRVKQLLNARRFSFYL